MATKVTYNGYEIKPTPFVSRDYQLIDFGNRWCNGVTVTLQGQFTGASGGYDPLKNSFLVTGFQAHKELAVYRDATKLLSVTGSFESIEFEKGYLPASSGLYAIPYSMKFVGYDAPSGIIDPSNEYSFKQNEDGTVTVDHKISAKAVKANDNSAFQNAVNFVNSFVGVNPYSAIATQFVPSNSGVLLTRNETINRLEGSYSVNETYQYNTGINSPYVEILTATIEEGIDRDYTVISLDNSYQGSPINSNLSDLRSAVSGVNIYTKLAQFVNTGGCYLNTYNYQESSGANTIQISASFNSGDASILSGFFDYDIDMTWDEILDVKTFTLRGEYRFKGSAAERRTKLDAFKTSVGGSYVAYTYSLITGSSVGKEFLTGHSLNPKPSSFTLTDNTGLSKLSIAASFNDADFVSFAPQAAYTVNVNPAKWIFEAKPSANIEGHYAIQDFSCKSAEKVVATIDLITDGVIPVNDTETLMTTIKNGVLVSPATALQSNSSVSSGDFSYNRETEWFTSENIPEASLIKVAEAKVLNNYLRPSGYKFGY